MDLNPFIGYNFSATRPACTNMFDSLLGFSENSVIFWMNSNSTINVRIKVRPDYTKIKIKRLV